MKTSVSSIAPTKKTTSNTLKNQNSNCVEFTKDLLFEECVEILNRNAQFLNNKISVFDSDIAG
jgi:hypothetical protein